MVTIYVFFCCSCIFLNSVLYDEQYKLEEIAEELEGVTVIPCVVPFYVARNRNADIMAVITSSIQ